MPLPRGRPTGALNRFKGLSPRAKLALRAVTVGAMKHKDAARVAGIHKAYVSMLKNSDQGREYMSELSTKIDDKSVELSGLMQDIGREAVGRLYKLMSFSNNENVVLRAASDLADRAPQTQKVQRHHVEAFTLSGKDAREIAMAMVEAAALREQYVAAATGDFVRIPIEAPRVEE